jgi:hypothetical protein
MGEPSCIAQACMSLSLFFFRPLESGIHPILL